jgi:hypothetical protein
MAGLVIVLSVLDSAHDAEEKQQQTEESSGELCWILIDAPAGNLLPD